MEHNRGWDSPRHSSWPIDPETGNRYKEFPLTLTGNQRQVVGRIEVLDNGLVDHNLWQYSAEIKQIEDAADGTALSPTKETQYWTVNGDRKKTIFPNLVLGTLVKIKSVTPQQVPEGQAVTITLERRFGNPLEPYPVQVRTWEPNQRMADGTNPAAQVHDVVFPAVPMTNLFVEYVTQTETLTVATWDDSVYEPRDTFMASLLVSSALTGETLLLSTKTATILDDDRPTITLSVDDTSITEGETATFTLTRGNNTANELIVGVSVDDPGGFLEGNFASEAVAVPSSIVFAPGETTREVAITPPDDWRDIYDNAITFTLAQEPHYDIVGSSSLTVQVADNDVAPQVSIAFNHVEVDEGTDLVLSIIRTGEDKNPLEIPITAGPVGDQRYHVLGMDAGMSRLQFTYRQPDDSFRGPDHHYRATLHPLRAEFWTPAGATTVNGAILDNDPYTVSVEAITHRVDEGNLLYYRISHDGHTGEPLRVMANHAETGSAVYDTILGNQTHTVPVGSSSITRGYLTHRNDGYDGDAEFTVELLADPAYEIDGGNSSASIIVRNKDPLPVLGFRDTGTVVSEGAGTVDIWVDLIAAVPPLKTVTVDYSARDWFSGDGFNITESTGTLTFAPGDTSAAITVEILQNSIAGYKDRFYVVLSNPVNAVLQDGVANLIHEGVIEDDESAVTLEAQAEAVDEGSDVILTLTRDGDTTDELTVWLQVAKTAPQADSRRDTVVFPAGDATVEHTITTTDDGQRAGSHTVTATLLDPPTIGETRTYWVGRPSSDTVTVRETHLETVTLLTPTLRVAEGESISLELTRSGRSPLTVTLEVTETGDFTTGTLPDTVSFGLQEPTATVTIPTQNDTTAEDIGKLTVTLVDGTSYRAGWPNSHTFTIYDDDGAKPSVSVTKDQSWVNEGQPVSFTVTRSTPTDNALQARLELNRVRYRVTQADLDDPTRGITTPRNHIHFDTEEVTVDFPAGTQTVTVTRQTTDDSLNYGNSTYHATVLNDADDDYIALSNASAKIWVQDDDIPTVTGSSTTSEFYDGRYRVVLPFTRTGDVSGRLPLDYDRNYTGYRPAPLQDETETTTWIKGHGFEPGKATGVSIGDLGYTKALGRSGSLELAPYYCPDNPAACGYYPQYQVGSEATITYRYYSNTMGVRIKADKGSVAEGDTATFTLHRHGGKPDAMTRPLEVQVSVTQEGEYISGTAPQTVTFTTNQSTAALSVPTTDDGVDETDGAIMVELVYTWSRDCDDEYCYRQKEYEGSPWYVRSVTTAVTDNDYVLPDVSVSDASADETDGTIEFTVSLSQANIERASSVDWSTAEDGSTTAATSDADFTAASGTVNFAIGETEKTVTVTLLDDQLDEVDETFNLVLSNPSELTLADDTGVGTILDDDIDYGIAFSGSTFHTEEGDDVLVSLQRLVPQEAGGGVCYVTIQQECFSVATEGDSANEAITVNLDITQVGDFLSSLPPTTVTFAQGVAVVELSLSTVDDSTVEADGSLIVNILEGTGYSPVYIGPPDSQNQGAPYRTLYLYDNDLAFSIDDVQADESAGQMDFTVSLNGAAPQEVTVDIATVDGEATSHGNVTATSLGQDFVAKTGTLIFAAGEQTKTFSVVTLDDTIDERNETFTVQLSRPAQNLNRYNSAQRWSTLTSLSDDTAVGTIDDDDQALIASVSRAYSVVSEDRVGPVRFTVELSHPNTTASERNPAVAWRTVPGTATTGADYKGENGRLTFMPGVNTGFIDVEIVDDNLFESSLETFSVELVASDSRLVTISPSDGLSEVSIRDNETLTASIAADAETVAEGNDTTFTVTLVGGIPADDVSVSFETAGTATVTDDYAAPKGAITFPPGDSTGKAGVLEISAGESKGTMTFPVLADGISDDDETLKVEIFSVATDQRAGSVSATDNIATTRILDQDNLTVSIEDAPSVTEGSSATFTITLSTVSDQDVSAGWATKEAGDALDAGETALPDKDYTAASGTVSIPAGDRSATFIVTTTQDTLVENAETFVVELEEATVGTSSPPEMVPLGVTKAEGTIIDDDTAPTGLTISSVSHSEVDEDAGATDITVTVALDGTTQFTVDTPVTVEMIDRPNVRNNATLGVDYTSTTSNVTIPAGESSVTTTITFTPTDDTVSEDNEVARLSAKSPVFADSAGKGVRIIDNDVEPGEVMLTVTPETVSESASTVQLTVTGTLAGQASRVIDTVVSLELGDDTATTGEDFKPATATLTIPAGEMSATASMNLEVLDDDIAEGDETLEITGAVPGTIVVTPAEVVIEDDDQEPTGISLVVTTAPISEASGAVSIPVRATLLGGGTRSEDTEVTMSVADVSATVSDDYTATWDSSTLTIPAGDFSGTANLTLTPVEDNIYEGNEQIAVRGANTDPGLPVNGVRLTILDNDPQPTTVTLSLDTDTVLEGSGTHFPMITATLEGDSTLTSDVNLTVNLKGDTQRSQSYTAQLFSPLSIEAGQSSGTADLWLIGTDDDVEDEDETVTIEGASDHPDLTVVAAQLTIANDDTSGVRVSPTSLTIREGERKFYSVALTSEPTSNVVLTVDVPANAGFTVSPGTVTFGPRSWGWKRVYVTGIEDPDADDEPAAEISHSLSSSDTKYAGAASDNVAITVKDITSASVVIAPTELGIGEGGSDAYTVVLDTQPTGDVTVTISGFADTALTLDKTTLTFTTSDWNVEQTVTVTANQDANAAEEVIPLANTVSGGGYDGILADSVVVTVTDDDTASVTVRPTAITVVGGRSNRYSVVLDTEPAGDVTVTISGVTGTDLSLDKTTLTFTDQDWDTAQAVRVSASANASADTAILTHDISSTHDKDYDSVTADGVIVSILQVPDRPLVQVGVTASDQELTVPEGGSEAYSIVLASQPEGDVTVAIAGVSGTDLTIGVSSLTFKTTNWNTSQAVTVAAAHDDDAIDDTETLTHTVTSIDDSSYDGLAVESVLVTVTDDETAGVTISETSLEIDEGHYDTYTVVLDTEPAGNVTVTIGGTTGTDLTLDKTTLTFTSGNWDTAQTVSVAASQDADAVDEEEVTITHTVTSTDYDGLAAADLPVTVTDDDTAGVTISETSLEIDEGDTETYTVVLDTEPVDDVTVTMGGVTGTDVSLDQTTLTFTSGNWNTPQTVRVTAEQDDDAVDEEVVTITHTVSSTDDSDYDGLAAPDVPVTVTDDDTVGVTISETSLEIEEGNSDTYTVAFDTEPAGNVTLTISGVTGTDVSLDRDRITFTPGNWQVVRTVTVTAEEDDDAIDEEVVTITHTVTSSDDSDYDGLAVDPVPVRVTDDDTAGVTISKVSLDIEEGDSDTYTVVLDTEPAGNVMVTIGGISGTELSLDQTTLTFTSSNWDTAQTVTVTAEQDDDAVDEAVVTITHTVTSTDDSDYESLAADPVPVTVTDDDTAGVTISETSLEIEEGDSDTYTVVLDTEPTGNVTVTMGGISGTDISLDQTTLTFTPGNWDTAQTVTVTAEQDDDAVDEEEVTITHTVASAGDSAYDGLPADSVTVTVTDDDTPSPDFTLTMPPPTHGDTDNDGKVNLADTLTYTAVATNSGNVPLEDVSVKDALVNTSGTDCPSLPIGATCTSTVTYTIVQADVEAGAVSNTATATATGVVDKTVSRQTVVDQVESLSLDKTTTASGFEGVADSISYSYKVTNSGTVTLTGTLEIEDDKIESGDITCPAVPNGGLAIGAFLTCTGSYTTVQTDVDAGRVTNVATASLGDVTSGGDSVTVHWQAPQGSESQLTVSSGEDDEDAGSFTFTVTLNPSSLQTVTVDYATSDGTATSGSDYTSASGTLTFSPGETTKNVNVPIAGDDIDEDDETFTITLSNPVNAGIPIASGSATIRDDDTAGVTVSAGGTGLDIDEGYYDTYTVVLESQPTHSVTITVNDPSNPDVTVYPADLTFTTTNWDTAQTVTVSARQDSGHDDENATVTHAATSSDTKYDGVSVADVSVNVTDDDDVPVRVSFEQSSYTVAEGNSVTVKVVLSADPERTVEVPITITNMDGAESADYSGVPASVVFNSGETEKTFDFEAIDDTVDDDGEGVRLTFGTLPGRVTSTSPSQVVVSITDDDVPSVTVSFAQATYTVAEGSSVTVKVKLSADPERTVTIPLTSTNEGGASASDYSNVPANVVFNSGDTEKTFDFSAASDSVDDDGESVKLGLGSSLPTGVTKGSPDETVVSITDDDVPSVTVSFGQATYTVAEGSNITVKVKLSGDPERTVTIPLTKTNQGGASTSDYFSVPANVVFNSGDTEKTFDFSASSDDVDDDNESVRLGFGSSLPTGVTEGTPDETVVSITDDDDPSVTVSFEQATYTVAEGSSVTVKVKLSADPERTVTIPLTSTNEGGASASDYSSVPSNMVFNSGDTEQTFAFSATSDSDNDDGESVRLGFGSSLPDGVTEGSPDETVVSITDDDVPSVNVSFEQATYTVAEGGSVTVKVKLDADPERTVTIPLTKTNQGGASASDYSNVPASVVFNRGDTEKTFDFEATQDTVDDDNESVRLGFGSSLPTGVTKGSPDEAVVSITDDDVPSVTVSFAQATYTVAEGSNVTVKVKLSAYPERTVTIPLTKTNQGGATSSDYFSVPANVVFNSGDTEKTFDFSAASDSVDDDNESVRLGFGSSLPTGVTEGSPDETVVSITDDDDPSVTVSFEQATYTVAEGSSVTVKVKLSADPERTVTIPMTKTNEGGASASDYSNVPANVVFNSGDTEKTFDFEATDDSDNDDGESVRLGLGNSLPTGVSEGSPDETVVSIMDDDVPSVEVSFEQASYTVAEGSNVTVKVKLSADPERMVTIPLTKTNQGGASGSDYSSLPGNVVFDSGETDKTFDFEATQDAVDDDNESVKLDFGSPLPTGVTEGSPDETVVSITDDDMPSVTVSFAQASYTVAEGSNVTVKVNLSADPERTVTIPLLRVNQDGASSADYSGVPPNVVFNSGDTEKTFSFEAIDDAVDDDGEGVRLSFGTLPTRVTSASPSQAVVSIRDDDVPSVTVSFEQASYTVTEGSSVAVKVILSAKPERSVDIPVSATYLDGVGSTDFSGAPTTLNFGASDTEKTLTFSATDDTRDDDGEKVRLGFVNLPAQVNPGSNSQATVSINDNDDPAVTVSFGSASYTVAEGSNVTVKVKLSADPERTVTIPLTKANEGGASGSDYSNVPTNMVFNSGETEKTFDFEATQDTVDDDNESVRLGFGSSLPTGVTEGSPDETVVSITDDDVPSVTVSFGQSSYSVAEGNSVRVKVVLSADPERTVEVPITVTALDGGGAADYSGVPASVVFNSGDTEKTFDFEAVQDTVNDDGERVRLTFGSLPQRVTSASPSQAVVSITDDDVPSVMVSFEQATYTVAEGSTVTVKVVLDANPERTVEVPIIATVQGGASASDYSGVPASVVFNRGDTEKTFDFNATQDTVDDDGESVKLGLGNLPTGVSAGMTNETTVSITDDDVPSVTVSFEQATYTVAEGSNVTVKVKLSADPERMVTIPLTKTNQGGATNSDYFSVPANVVFSSGDTEKTFDFSAASDNVDDDNESVRLGFGSSLPTGVTEGSPDETVVSITDDDDPSVTVSFEQASYTVAEGSTVTVKVKLSADPERTVTIPLLRVNQGGASAADYSGVPANVVFNSGDTEKTFSFAATDDSDNDDGESVRVSFGTLPAQVSEGTNSATTVSITDDDVRSVTVSFEQGSYTVAEGSSVTVKVKLDADPERTVTIPLNKDNQGGASASDYNVPNSVVFNSGDTEKTFDFEAIDDTVDDDGESVKLGLGNLPTGVSAGTTNETTVSITDDDVPSVTVSFAQATYTVAEGSNVTVKVKLSADPERTVTIPLTKTEQGGASNSDYSGVPESVVFNSGDTEKTFSFAATDDSDNDDGESVKLGLGNLPTGVSAGTTDETTVSITDDDVPSVIVSFGSASHSVIEGESTTITVTLSADPERTVTIPIVRTNQDDASDSDYSGVPSSVVFASGDTEKTFSFSATDDEEDDNDESVKLTFDTLPAGVTEGAINETVVEIVDNDGGREGEDRVIPVDDETPVTVNFEQASYIVPEGSSVTVKVTLDQDPARTVTIPLTKTDQGGASTSDYSNVPANVVFNSGDTEKTFDFEATQDTVDDDGESVKLGLGTLPTGVSAGTTNETVVSITDDDDPSVTVSFGQSSYTVAEGNSVRVKVVLSADPERTVEVPITVTTLDGAGSADYSGVPASVVFNSGDTEKTFDFEAVQDTVDDDGEGVRLTFGTLPGRVNSTSPSQAVVSITDDDVPSVTVSFGQATYTVAEGSSVTVKVKLSADPERTVTIPLTKTNEGGASSSDYSNVPANVVFNSGDTEKTFDFEATQDAVDDDGESVKLGFGSSLPTGVTKGSPDETVVSITDDDVPSVTVSFVQGTYTVAEGSNVTVGVKLSTDPERTVSIPLTKTHQGGASSSDYFSVPQAVVFNSGDTEKTFDFSAASDSDDDDGDSVKLGFGSSLPIGVNEGSPDQTVVSITDDDVPSVTASFEQATYSVAEGGSVTVKVKLDADPERTVTIPLLRVNQGGASAADYSGVPANVVFNSGDTEKTFDFEATDDAADDDGESVRVSFGTLPAQVSAGTNSGTTVSITDDDTTQNQVSVQVSFQDSAYSLTEGSTTDVTVTLSEDPERNVSVPLTIVNGTGTTSDDYSGVPASVDFASGETEKSFTLSAVQDDIDEDSEELTLGFDTLPDGVSAGTTAQATITIVDSIHLSFGASYYQAYEGGSGALVTVQLDNAPVLDTVIPITATEMNGATSADWTGVPDTLTFGPGQSSRTFTVMAYDDTVEDSGESVELGFGTLPPGVARGAQDTATVELMNMEVPQVNRYMCPSDAGERIVLENVGEITQAGEADFWRVKLDPYRVYIIEVLGKDSGLDVMNRDTHPGDLTLEDPVITAIWDDGRNVMRRTGAGGSDDGGTGRNSLDVVNGFTPSGWHEIEVQGKGGTGSYQIKVRINNFCRNVNGAETYPYFGGPDGYVLDTAGDVTTDKSLMTTYSMNWRSVTGYLGDNWNWYRENEPDVDWIRVHLKTNHEYTIELWTEDDHAAEYQATDLKILGIYDASGAYTPDSSSSESGVKVTLNYEPDTGGVYYVAVGSGERDHTGTYSLSIQGTPDPSSMNLTSNSPASGAPGIEGAPQTGQTLNATTSGIQDQDGMSGAAFSYQWIRHDLGTTADADIDGATSQTYTVTVEDEGKALKVKVTFTDDAGNGESLTSFAVIVSPAPTNRAEPVNSSATGAPGIEGSPVVGQTLTATTTGIADENGISKAAFAYQWFADDAEIDGANASTYTVVPGDVGKEFRVRVTFTDDAGNEESLTSKATGPLAAALAPLTVSLETSPASHNGTDVFTFEIRFSEQFQLSFRALRDHTFMVEGGTVKKAQRLKQGSNIDWTITVEPDSSAAVTIVLPATLDCENSGAICTEDGRMLSNRLEFTVSGPGG